MNRRSQFPGWPVRMPQALRMEILSEVDRNPRISSKEIAMNIIGRNHKMAIFFFRKRVGDTFSPQELYEIYTSDNEKEAKRLYNKYIQGPGRLEFDPGVINRVKSSLNRTHAPDNPGTAIYGAAGLGYILERDLTPQSAAQYLYPRFKQQQHEAMHTKHAINIIIDRADTPERRKVADMLRIHANRAVIYNRLKGCADGLRLHYLQSSR